MGCGASMENPRRVNNELLPNHTVGPPIPAELCFHDQNEKYTRRKYDPSARNSNTPPERFERLKDQGNRANHKGIGATCDSRAFSSGRASDDEHICTTTLSQKSAETSATLPQYNSSIALSNGDIMYPSERRRISTPANLSSLPPLQRQLSRSGHRRFVNSSQSVPTPPHSTNTHACGKRHLLSPKDISLHSHVQASEPPQNATASAQRISISLPRSFGDLKAGNAGVSESPSSIAAPPSYDKYHADVSKVRGECIDTDSCDDNNTSGEQGILPPLMVMPQQGSTSRLTKAFSGNLNTGFGSGRGGVSPKGATVIPKRSQSTGSLLSLDGNSNNAHALSSYSDFGREILGGSPILSGLATGESDSRPQSARLMRADRHDSHTPHGNNGLAVFFNRPRECALCQSATVTFACQTCEDFFLCEDCRFNVENLRAVHDPAHVMLCIQENHCNTSRTFGGDSIFSLSGEGGMSSLFYSPCFQCKRVIDDFEVVYRCEQCDYILCEECFIQQRAQGGKGHAGGKASPAEHTTPQPSSSSVPPHEHELKRFRRKPRTSMVSEGTMFVKSRSSDGNKIINDYVVVRQLGHGSYAKVKLVQHIRTHELFALKILRRQKKSALSGFSLGRSRAKAAKVGVSEDDLLREIAVMKFIDHPNVVQLKEVIEDMESQKVYVIMEYCEKGPVHLAGDPPLPIEQVRRFSADILRGLLHLHSEFLYHGDIKPANCLVKYDGAVKIADFGTCNSQVCTKLAEGTLAFNCPEQVRGEEVSGEAVDSWAFALTVCEMALGALPVSTTSLMEHRSLLMNDSPVPVGDTGDKHLNDLLARMLEKDLSKRLLVSGAVRHPFFTQCHESLLDATEQLTSVAPTTSDEVTSTQQSPQQFSSLTELYEKGLASVHRGKNLKDHFYGVRALRRVRRKEVETARHTSSVSHTSSSDASDGESHPCGIHNESVFGVSNVSGSDGDDEDGTEISPIGGRRGNEKCAEKLVEEIMEQQLSSQDPKLELTYISLSAHTTLEKLNRLGDITSEIRMSHNVLECLAPLRFSSFPSLMEIVITSNRLVNFPEEVLEAPRLVRLDLSHNRIESITKTLPTKALFLERLSLHHNFITSVGTTTIPVVSEPGATAEVSILAAPCLHHVRLSGNPLERLPEALETTHRLQLVLDAIPALMEQWDTHIQSEDTRDNANKSVSKGTSQQRLPAVIVWDDSFPVRIPGVEPAVWLAASNVAIYRLQTLQVCKTRRVVLCQCADPRFPNGLFHSEELEVYFTTLNKALQSRREERRQLGGAEAPCLTGKPLNGHPYDALPAIMGRRARRYVESYFFVTEDENAEEGGYHSLVAYLYESLAANIPVLIVVVSSTTSTTVRTNIVAAISTCLTRLRGNDPDHLDAEQAAVIVSTMRGLYA